MPLFKKSLHEENSVLGGTSFYDVLIFHVRGAPPSEEHSNLNFFHCNPKQYRLGKTLLLDLAASNMVGLILVIVPRIKALFLIKALLLMFMLCGNNRRPI